jgi:hypothetical protein
VICYLERKRENLDIVENVLVECIKFCEMIKIAKLDPQKLLLVIYTGFYDFHFDSVGLFSFQLINYLTHCQTFRSSFRSIVIVIPLA